MCSFLWKCHKNSLIETLQSLLESDTLLDCTIAAGGQYLKAHKVILAASSPYFKLLFSQEQEKNPIVVLKDVSFQELQCIIEYIYKGEVEVPPGQVKSFLRTADSLQIVGLLGSTQEKVDEGNSGCIAVTSNVSIAHKQSKHIYQETNLRENASTQAHFSATDESSEISPLNISSVHSKTSSVSPFHFKEKCVQDSSRIHNRNQNFDAPSSEILVENIVETNLVNDNHPVVPFVDKKLITDNHEDRGLSNYCDSSLTHDACDNTTVNDTRERQKESVVNSFSMQQEPFLIIKQDPDSVEISEEHYEDRMGYCGGDFLEGNSTVGPQGDVVNAPHTPDDVDRSGYTVVLHVGSLFCEEKVQPFDLQHSFKESDHDVGNISASFQTMVRNEDHTIAPLKRPRGRPPKKRRQDITQALSCPRGRLAMTENEMRSYDLEPVSEYYCHPLTSCETLSDPLLVTPLAPALTPHAMKLSEVKTIAPLKRPRGRPPKTLNNQKMSSPNRPRGRPRKENIPLALRCLRSQKVLNKYLLFSQRRLRVRPSKRLSQDKTQSKNSQVLSIKKVRKDNITLGGLPIKSESSVSALNRSRGRPRKTVGDYLKRPRGRRSEALSKYFAFPSLTQSHNHQSKTSIGGDITLKRPRGRPPKTSSNKVKNVNKSPSGRTYNILTKDKIKPEDRRSQNLGVTIPLKRPRGRPRKTPSECSVTTIKRPRGRPRKTPSECSVTTIKRPRGRPPKGVRECNMPVSSHSSFEMSENSVMCRPENLMNEIIPPLENSYVPLLKNEPNTPLERPCSTLIQTLLEDSTIFGEGLLVAPSETRSENFTLCSSLPKALNDGDNISLLEDFYSFRSMTLSEESMTPRDFLSHPMNGDVCAEDQCCSPSISSREHEIPCDSPTKLLSGNDVSPLECPPCPSSMVSNEEPISPCQPPLD